MSRRKKKLSYEDMLQLRASVRKEISEIEAEILKLGGRIEPAKPQEDEPKKKWNPAEWN